MEKCLIVAAGRRNEIGVKGDLPWHIRGDLQYFKKMTMSCPVIMGRTTWESLPVKPLPGRQNLVLSHSEHLFPGAERVRSLDEAFALASSAGRCFVMGGASVYREAINKMDTLYVTHIEATVPEADAFFPEIDPKLWFPFSISPLQLDEASGLEYRFVIYKKR